MGAVAFPPIGQALAGLGQGAFHDLERGEASGAAGGGQDSSPADHSSLLFGRVEKHERGVGDPNDRGQGRGVRVVDHDRPGFGVDPLPQPGSIAGECESPGGSGLEDAPPVAELSARGAPHPDRADGRPFDQRAATHLHEGQRHAERDDGDGQHDRADVQSEDKRACGGADHDQLWAGQAEQYAAPGEAGELDRGQPRLGRCG